MSRKYPKRSNLHVPRWKRNAVWLLCAAVVAVACLVIRQVGGPSPAAAKPPAGATARPAAATKPVERAGAVPADADKKQFVAAVNSQRIGRDELARECLRHYGPDVLEMMVNKHLILSECKARKVAVSDQEVEVEIDRLARKFALPKDQYLKMLKDERQIGAAQYREQVWLTLALRKLAAAKLTVSRQELEQAYETGFGEAVKARLIAVRSAEKARSVHAQAVAQPVNFGALARQHSEDVASASLNGLIQPIRRHAGDPKLEQAVFALKTGQISPIVKVGDQHVFVRCEGRIAASQVDRAKYDPVLTDAIRERKLRGTAAELFQQIQQNAKVENVFNDPAKKAQFPGVAAIVNGRKITLDELATECANRYGIEVLEGILNRSLIEQALKRKKLTVSDEEIQAEVARAAVAMGKTTRSGQADVEGWIAEVTKQQGVSREVYIRDAVWPSVALKKLVEGDKQLAVSDEDVKRGIEANYGPRARCRAIVLHNQRKAQEVWEKARRVKDADEFGDLAEKYSVETASKYNRGEVPPIQRHGGQPLLERAAFELRAGETSGIIQAGDNYVILHCEGYTEPVKVKPEEVRQLVLDDIREKKYRTAMAREFERLQAAAVVDNYLTGVIKRPKVKGEKIIASPLPNLDEPTRK